MESNASDRILEAAIRSFAEVGYGATSTSAVAREAGVTQPLVHHHFGSKEGMWRAAVDRVFAGVRDIISDAETDEGLVQAGQRLVRIAAARPEMMAIVGHESAAPSERLTYLLDNYMRAPMQLAVAGIARAQREGTIDQKLRPELLLLFMMGAASHAFTQPAMSYEALGIDIRTEQARNDFAAVMTAVLSGVLRKP